MNSKKRNYLFAWLLVLGVSSSTLFGMGLIRQFATQTQSCPAPRTSTARISDRKIAVLGYGSLINQLTDSTGQHTLNIQGSFQKTPVNLPIDLLRISSKGTDKEKISRVITPNGQKLFVYAASSAYGHLPDARKNLAKREGAGEDLRSIYYLKTLRPEQNPDNNEKEISDGLGGTVIQEVGDQESGYRLDKWVMRNDVANLLSLEDIQKIAYWANESGYDAVIWAGFPANADKNAIRTRLSTQPDTLTRTKQYIQNLPEPLTEFEKEILGMQ